MNDRIYYTTHQSPNGLCYRGNSSEKGDEPYPLHEDQGNGTFKRYRIAPPQTETLEALAQQMQDNLKEQRRLQEEYTRLYENYYHYKTKVQK